MKLSVRGTYVEGYCINLTSPTGSAGINNGTKVELQPELHTAVEPGADKDYRVTQEATQAVIAAL